MYSTTGSDSDKLESDKITRMESKFTSNEYLDDDALFEQQGMLIVQMQKLMDEFDEIRRHITNDVVGQQGPKGDKGDTGATGARGATGAAGADGRDGADGRTPTITDLDASRLPTRKPSTRGKLWNDRGIVKVS